MKEFSWNFKRNFQSYLTDFNSEYMLRLVQDDIEYKEPKTRMLLNAYGRMRKFLWGVLKSKKRHEVLHPDLVIFLFFVFYILEKIKFFFTREVLITDYSKYYPK